MWELDFILLELRFVQMQKEDACEWAGWRERFETPGKETGVSNQGGEGHKREADELDDYLGCTTSKVNSRWTIHLHVNSKTVKLLE